MTAALRSMGLADAPGFNRYHHVLSRAVWSPLDVAQTLLRLLLARYCATGEPLLFGIDETIERRWGRRIAARGIYRDAVRSSGSHFVKTSGLRWISVMLLAPVPWAARVFALPVLTALAPSARYYQQRHRTPKTLLARALQLLKVLKRWLPGRDIVVVGDSSYAALDFLHHCQQLGITFITRLRLDAALYDPAPPYSGRGRPRKKGARQPTLAARLAAAQTPWFTVDLPWYGGQRRRMQLSTGSAWWYHVGKAAVPLCWVLVRDPAGVYAPLALLATDETRDPQWIVSCFVKRWQIEVTFEEARRHLGLASQRQWSAQAIRRTTPFLLGLFSFVVLLATILHQSGLPLPTRQSAWYPKALPTFSDALALVRQHLWQQRETFLMSAPHPDIVKIPRAYLEALLHAACYAA